MGDEAQYDVNLLTFSIGGVRQVTIEIHDPVLCFKETLEDESPDLSVAKERARLEVIQRGGDPKSISWHQARKSK